MAKYTIDTDGNEADFLAGIPPGMTPEIYFREIVAAAINNGRRIVAQSQNPVVQNVDVSTVSVTKN